MDILDGNSEYQYKEIDTLNKNRVNRENKEIKENIISEFETEDQKLLESLKKFRLELARERKVPAFVIFSDTTLYEMVTKRPKDLQEFSSIKGVGKQKLLDLGEKFLEIINDKVEEFSGVSPSKAEKFNEENNEVKKNSLLIERLNKNDFYKLENEKNFTPFYSRSKNSFWGSNFIFDTLCEDISAKREKNLEENKLLNAGFPVTHEELDHICEKFNQKWTAKELESYFQRSIITICTYLTKKIDINIGFRLSFE